MGKNVHREVIDGHMTVSQVRIQKGKEYKDVEVVGAFSGETREVTKRRPGYTYVEVLVYAGDKEEGEPVLEWEMPKELRYDLRGAATLTVRQQRGKLKPVQG